MERLAAERHQNQHLEGAGEQVAFAGAWHLMQSLSMHRLHQQEKYVKGPESTVGGSRGGEAQGRESV
jgi:hypothetical protein